MTSLIDTKETEKIVLEHLLRVRQLEDETCLVLRGRVDNLIARLLLKMNQKLKAVDTMKCYDSLYYRTEALKEGYEGFLTELEENPGIISEEKVKEIFFGLRKMAGDFLTSMPSKDDNPITYERMVLISAAVLRNKQYWMECLDGAFGECTLGNAVSKKMLMTFMTKKVHNFFFEGMFTAQQHLAESLALMSEFEEGKRYEHELREQSRQLNGLAMLQKDVILSQASTEEESHLLKSLLDRLEDCYRLTVAALEQVDEKAEKTIEVHEIFHMEQVDEMLDAYVFNDADRIGGLLQMAGEIHEESAGALRSILETEGNYRSSEISKKIQRDSEGYQRLSQQLVGLFTEAVCQLDDLPDTCATEGGRAIAEGISATMSLKMEAIGEKDVVYREGKKQLSLETEELVRGLKEAFVQQTDQILEDILEGSERLLNRTGKSFLEGLKAGQERHFKFDMAYLKNDLLFELRTFEELIEHSLKKLIELEQEDAGSLTAVMLGTMERSRDILAGHGIELIIPGAHDRFDAKAHEVLLAETTQGFTKGQVVRCINVGYKLADYVIIRASVLAAR